MSLMVVQSIPTPGDYAPDAYLLINAAQTQLYKFVPHNGVEKITHDEANEMIASSVELSRKQAAALLAKVMA
jgi:catalase